MQEPESDLNRRIAERISGLRAERGMSLDALSKKSGVSRSMISLIERGESNPTAVVLERLAAGLGVTLPALFDGVSNANEAAVRPVARRDEQAQWKDPASGYVRRNVTPPGVHQPMQLAEIFFPPGKTVAFETAGRNARVDQQIWMLEGVMEVTVGEERYRLQEGDCLAMQLGSHTVFHNPTRKTARYAVVIASESSSAR